MQAVVQTGITRRAIIQGIGVGALGLAGAALLGCGGGSSSSSPGAVTGDGGGGAVTEATGVEVLPLTAPTAKGTAKKGGTFSANQGVRSWVEHDSHTQRGASEWHVISEKLVECDPISAKTLPHIASSWEVADPKTLVFKIKPGIKIHNKAPWNGREFDATDVAWNLERIGGLYAERLKLPTSAFQRASMVTNIMKAEAVDKQTVKVTLSAPNSGLFAGLSENRTVLMPKEMDDIGYKDPMKFGGPGPYQMSEFNFDRETKFKKFDQYFRPGEPSFDELNLQVIPDRASYLAAFSSGQIQLANGLNEEEAAVTQRSKSDALLYTWVDCNWNHIRPSVEYQPFRDFRVRNAVHMVLDYATLGNGAYGSGWGYQAALSPGFPEAWKPNKVRALPGYNPDTKEKDRAEGVKMMEAAGFPGGKGLDFAIMYTGSSDLHRDNATRFQSQLKSAFPEMKMDHKSVDSGTFSKLQSEGNFQTLSYVITAVPDAVLEMISQYHSKGSRNYGHFNEPSLDALLDKALGELDQQKRTAMLDEFQTKWVNEWRPMYVLHANAVRNLLQSDVGGYDTLAGTWYGYSTWTKVCRLSYLEK